MMHAVRTDESLRIEYDDSIVCDVCRDVSYSVIPSLFIVIPSIFMVYL